MFFFMKYHYFFWKTIDIDKKILQNININKILYRLECGILNRAGPLGDVEMHLTNSMIPRAQNNEHSPTLD